VFRIDNVDISKAYEYANLNSARCEPIDICIARILLILMDFIQNGIRSFLMASRTVSSMKNALINLTMDRRNDFIH